ncbi:uncharacterized protein [Chelonus insularis]|uniref:uncharacterized protein n=1 Tax=Chelonus insularis TaxID=460826 RepID=UPI00158A3AED|nr:uncharacterized protein LOC118067842 [Chelonus insularis]
MTPNDATFQVPLLQMLDLALGTPEVGSVNFNILHNFLYILLRQTSLNNVKAEYRGDDAARIKAMVASLKDGSNFYLHESDIIDTDGNIVQGDYVSDEAVVTVNFSTIDDQIPQKNSEVEDNIVDAPKTRTVVNVQPADKADNDQQSVDEDLYKKIHQMNKRITDLEINFEYILDDVTNLREIISASQPAELEPSMLPEAKSLFNESDYNEKFHQEKIWAEENTEEEDIEDNKADEGDNDEENKQFKDFSDDKILIEEQRDDIKSSVYASKVSGLTTASLAASKISQQFSKSFNYAGQLNNLKEEVSSLKNDMAKIMQDVAEIRYHVDQLVVDKEEIAEKAAEKEAVSRDIIDVIEIQSVGQVSSDIPQTVDEAETFIEEVDVFSVESLPNSEILAEDQSEYSDGRKSSKKLVSTVSTLSKPGKDSTNDDETLKDFKDEKKSLIAMIEKVQNKHEEDFKKIDSRVKVLEQMLNFDGFEGIKGMKDVVQNIKNIEIDIERMNWTIENLNKEKESRDKNMDILTEQVELLKIMKADREDLEDALASKADATVVDRKVSYNRFDTAYEELTNALEDTILKSNQQETALKETLNTVQQEIDNKLDKTEVSPIQEYMEEKLQALQDKLKQLNMKKRESEAAGAKKILTGLQCITCDRDVIMKREQNALDYADPMPYRKMIKPYLTYKLDQTRKHPRRFPAKHINLFTAAVQDMNKHKFLSHDIMEKSSRDHFSNRYCGGSHTITTPQQRVMRMGHFLTDWGPEIIQLNKGTVRGADGQLYHCRPMPPGTTNVPKVCGLDENVCCNLVDKSENFQG